MKQTFALFIVALFVFSLSPAIAQEDGDSSAPSPTPVTERLPIEVKDKADNIAVVKDLKLVREFQRRVPNGYGPVVDAVQREQIYKIQAEYFDVIAMLELRLELLKKERDAKIEGVLTPSQLERVQRPVLRRGLLPRAQ